MCGIAGYIGKRRIGDEVASACLKAMRHRGPDGAGIYRHELDGNHVLLLHTRLSIIDPGERSDQPMRRGPRTLVFNGELYNHVELRRSLEERGEIFKTASDTEVLLSALCIDGANVHDVLEGMWAFALYDENVGELLLSRDRFGEKPLHIYKTEHGVYFASEVKQLLALTGERFQLRMDQVRRYLVNGYKSLFKCTPGFFEGVTSLSSGHFAVIGRDCVVKPQSYWKRDVLQDDMTFEEAVQGVRERLLRSMELRLRSDVPIAFCMSGGIDSNSLLCSASREFGYDVHGFTILSSDARYAEKELVDLVVGELGLKHTGVPSTTENFLPNLRQMVRGRAAPVSTISYYVHRQLMQHVGEAGYKVSVSGTAADELFTGYYDHQALYLQAIENDPDLFDVSLRNWREHVGPIVRNPFLQDPLRFVETPGFRDHIYLDADSFAEFLIHPWSESFAEEQWDGTPLRNRMLNELFHESVPVILHEDDMNAMSFSIENRSPFLDRELFEFSRRIPTRHLIRDGKTKAVLREAMRGIVPDAVLECRRKVGFNASITELLDLRDDAVRAELLADSPVFDVVRRDRITELIDDRHFSNSRSKFLFSFLGIKMLMEEFDPIITKETTSCRGLMRGTLGIQEVQKHCFTFSQVGYIAFDVIVDAAPLKDGYSTTLRGGFGSKDYLEEFCIYV